MLRLVLLRHGESIWNREKRFTGWADVALSARGAEQARRAGLLLRSKGFRFDLGFSSCLVRAADTLRIVFEAMGLGEARQIHSWRLNERHYGALEGMAHGDARRRWGTKQVFAWQRHFSAAPPPIEPDDERHPRHDPRYASVERDSLPSGESLRDTLARALPFWEEAVMPEIRAGRQTLVVAHGNTLRALIMHLDGLSESDVLALHVPTAEPLVYELDENGAARRRYYLRWRARLLDLVERVARHRRGGAS